MIDSAGCHRCSDTPEIFDESETQHRGDCPELAQPQDGDGLVGRDKTGKAIHIQSAVAMRDRLERDVIDAWKAGRRAVHQSRESAAVAFRQMPLGSANLFFDEIKVIEKPFAGRCDAAFF